MILHLDVTTEEHAVIKAHAHKAQLPLAGYMIAAAMNPDKFATKSGVRKRGA